MILCSFPGRILLENKFIKLKLEYNQVYYKIIIKFKLNHCR